MVDQQDGLEKRPTRQLIARLVAQIRQLLHYELLLAQKELGGKVRGVALAGLCLGAALACAALGGLGLLVTAVVLLALVVPLWAAALIVTGAFLVLAAISALAAKSFLAGVAPLLPERTIESLKEDLTWAKRRVRSNND